MSLMTPRQRRDALGVVIGSIGMLLLQLAGVFVPF